MTTATTATTTATATATTTDRPAGAVTGSGVAAWRSASGSTRLRLAGVIVGVMAVATLLGVVAVRTIVTDRLDRRIEMSLEQERREFEGFIDAEDRRGLLAAGRAFIGRSVLDQGEALVVVEDRVGVAHSAGAPYRLGDDTALRAEWAGLTEARRRRVTTPVGEAAVLAVPVVDDDSGRRVGTLVVANFLQQERDEVAAVFRVLVQVAIGAILVVGIFAWSIAGRVLRPLRLVTETAQRISEEDVTRRLPERRGDDEMSELVRTFNGMLDRLERGMLAQREFLADAGHELRTPLTIVRGHMDELSGGLVPPEEVPTTHAIVSAELRRMSRLVDDLLELAHAEQPDFLALGPVDLADLTQQLHLRAMSFDGPEWRCAPAHGVITADAERLTQAGLNLIVNAARHSPAGRPILIGSSIGGGEVRIWIDDSGPGVPPELVARVLDRNVRGADRRREGLGLGLAVTRAVAEAHGGRVEISRSPFGGARFSIILPEEGPR